MSNVSACCTKVALVLALAQLAQHAGAQGAPAAAAPKRAVSAQTVGQKISMLNQVLNHSQVAIRVQAGGSDKARQHLSAARDLTARARSLSAAGQLGPADALLDEAIWEVSRAQQLVPDTAARQVSDRERYQQLENSVAALRNAAQMAPTPSSGGERPAARAEVLVQKAIGLAASARYAEANEQLDQALALLLTDVSANLGGRTVVYDGRFTDRRQEFDFELERHRSFERLVPLALTQLRPPPSAVAVVDRHVANARELRARGEAMAGGDIGAAIGHVVAGTDALRRALQATGLVVPQAMGEK